MNDAKQEYTEHVNSFRVDGQGVPEHLKDGLVAYVVRGIRPGTFLINVLRNNLHGAVLNADQNSLAGLLPLVRFLDIYLPNDAHGSLDRVERWIQRGGITKHGRETDQQ